MLSRRRVTVDLPLLMLLLLAVWTVARSGRVPSPMATHFDVRGRPNGLLPREIGLAIAPVLGGIAAIGLAVATRAGSRVRNLAPLTGVAYGIFGFVAGLQLGLLASNAGADRAAQARLAGMGWLGLTAPFAALGVWAGLSVRHLPVAGSAGGANVEVVVGAEEIEIRVGGWDSWLAFRRRIVFPRRLLLSVEVVPRRGLRPSGLRVPGTSVPGLITAGSYGTGPRREFWAVHSGDEVVVLTLAGGAPYQRIVLQPADPQAMVHAFDTAIL